MSRRCGYVKKHVFIIVFLHEIVAKLALAQGHTNVKRLLVSKCIIQCQGPGGLESWNNEDWVGRVMFAEVTIGLDVQDL